MVYEVKNAPFFERNFTLVGHYMIYNLVGRTEVEPLPIDPDFKLSNRLSLIPLHPVLAPAESRGAGLIRYRYQDPNRGDAWTWIPTTRRVRRLNETMMSHGGRTGSIQTTTKGFSAKNENYDWKFLGEKQMLGAVNLAQVPGHICQTDGGGSVCPAK
jgi:hypothetical protein